MGRKSIISRIKNFLSHNAPKNSNTKSRDDMDVQEEYANALRTESYFQFWTRVHQLDYKDSVTCTPTDSTTSTRLMSYRLFAENLLDPNQITVTRIIQLIPIQPSIRVLLSDYFSETSNASFFYSMLLRDVDYIRSKYESLKPLIQYLTSSEIFLKQHLEIFMKQLMEVSRSVNPFILSGSSVSRIQIIQSNCSNLLNRLEFNRDKTRAKFKVINRLKHSSGILVMALTTTLLVIIATHAFSLLIAAPSLSMSWFKPTSVSERLIRASAQLDVAAKGAYILTRDLDTISRLVTRLNDELEHVQAMAKFWAEKGLDRPRAGEEVARQLKRSDESFCERLDELEEHLYLCFMTINRARNLVVREILNPGRPSCPLGPKSKKNLNV